MIGKHRLFAGAAAGVFALLVGASGLMAKDPSLSALPEYNAATVVHAHFQVADFKIVPSPDPFAGAHLFVKGSNGDTIDVFLGPAKYVKIFNLPLNAGDRVDVLGSELKVKGGGTLILGREVTKGPITMILRDDSGTPMWLDWME